MIDIIKAIVLGIVEGLTEWLPISSTGHLIIADQFLALGTSAEFKEMFNVVIQLGAILAVVVLYWNRLWPFTGREKGYVKRSSMQLWIKVLIAVIPSAVIGLFLDDWLDKVFYKPVPVSIMLILYGVLFIIVERFNRTRHPAITTVRGISWKTAALIGAFQVLALIPGTSRSGATILGAILIGCSRSVSAEFSFFLAVPTMIGASLLKLVKFGFHFSGLEFVILLTGMLVAFIVSVLAIKFLLGYIKKKDFTAFGYYRIVLGLLVLLLFACGVIHNPPTET